jgi:hypothetical protein
MANVTIKLTVNTVAILNNRKDPQLGTNCRLSQSGGEDIGNYMAVDPSDSEMNISHVTVNDVITWVGIPAEGDNGAQINITEIHKDGTGGSVLGDPLSTSWAFGTTIIRQVLLAASFDDYESYKISFSINAGGESVPLSFDPKIRVNAH